MYRSAVVLLLVLTSVFGYSQSCLSAQGTWTWSYDNSVYTISQDGSGNLTGFVTENCYPGMANWPLTGTINGNFLLFTATNPGSCGQAQWIKFNATVGQPGCNYLYGGWTNSVGGSGLWGESNPYPSSGPWVTKAADVPTSESTTNPSGVAWDKIKGGAPWEQTLSPDSPSGEFAGRSVYEVPGTGRGSDTCWFTKSKYAPFTSVTGGQWSVTANSMWGYDWVGWSLAAVRYYRSNKRVPCGNRAMQQMIVDAAFSPNNPSGYGQYTLPNGTNVFAVSYGNVNTLGGDITATTVTSTRAGQTVTNTTWK